ncbi:class I SAM-dependent methyltransferase [Pelagibacteraceae bacterium]|nr:class I SAM-dependent methyltransferase [Pelagibacteraceae bacterium]
MFRNYMYVSGTSKVLVEHFKNYFLTIQKKINLKKKSDKILDIACNDGTFLNFFIKSGFRNVIGVEPATNLKKLNKDKKIDINSFFFTHKNSFKLKKKYKSFKIITANNVCAHIPDIKDFVLGVKNILEPDGLFIFEVSYLKDVVNKLTFDTIYHEHMSYHSLKPLLSFFERLGMSVLDFDLVEAQGGSIRVYVGHKNQKIYEKKINNQIKKEKKMGLLDEKLFKKFHKRIQNQKKEITTIIDKNITKKNKILMGYGAPAKVTTFSYVFNLGTKSIRLIVDDNPLKQKKFTPGKNIKIISFEELKAINFDYIIILAWNFAPSIIKKLRQSIKKPFKIIVPFPKATIK